jgi:hypothetical protein
MYRFAAQSHLNKKAFVTRKIASQLPLLKMFVWEYTPCLDTPIFVLGRGREQIAMAGQRRALRKIMRALPTELPKHNLSGQITATSQKPH